MHYAEHVTRVGAISALALAINALFLFPASADESWLSRCAPSQTLNACQQPFQQGLAPVLLGSAKEKQGKWGFMDTSGHLVIEPAFSDAQGFVNGLAAVAQDGKYGYIDQRGKWAIPARFTRVTPFNAEGTALVEINDRLALIDKQGAVVRTLPFAVSLATDGFVGGQSLASVQMQIAPALWRADIDRALALPDDVMALEAPQSGLVPAQKRDTHDNGYWGYLNEGGEWAIDPMKIKSRTLPKLNGDTLAVQGKAGWFFIDRQGTLRSKTPYKTAAPLANGNWLVQTSEGAWQLLNGALEKQPDLPAGLGDSLRPWHQWQVGTSDAGVVLIGPDNHVTLLPAENAKLEVRPDSLWIRAGKDAHLEQIVDTRGVGLLSDVTLKALAGYQLKALRGEPAADDTDASRRLPLAILTPTDSKQPLALLSAHGEIVTDPQWAGFEAGADAAPLRVRTQDKKMGAVDANGQWVVAPQFVQVQPFTGDYAWATVSDGKTESRRLIDRSGNVQDIPTRTLQMARDITGNLLLTAAGEGDQQRWGVWDIAAKRELLAPTFEQIEPFAEGYALARSGKAWGVITPEGRWALAAQEGHGKPQAMGHGLYLLETGKEAERRFSLVNAATSRTLAADLLEKPRAVGPTHWLVKPASGGVALIDADGRPVMEKAVPVEKATIDGERVLLSFGQRYGAINARGEWQVAPIYTAPLTFSGPRQWAVAHRDQNTLLIDGNGGQPLPEFPTAVPLAGMNRVAENDPTTGQSVLRDFSGQEIQRYPGLDSILVAAAGGGVVPLRGEGNRYGLIDESGATRVAAYFDQLGPLHDERARAVKRATYGALNGYIDKDGHFAIKPAYSAAGDFSDHRAWVVHKGVTKLIDSHGKVQAQVVVRCNQRIVITAKGRPLWPAKALTCAGSPQGEKR
ncbi:WG repeat-containing protein [Nissabacter sp. SGAir0207]|uniref:WG repeat-containing protein n=1 Tax=Nissabacter sp. SGAir0207 TaxID=2126321 RepID=UPI0010CCCB97|nr:WG repeat-containing protein [Nissabacter sp. SGAir0207]QCR36345.1 hypothetical protein C1N62_09690 [Nissabacter sp. SGAir0207]